MSDFESKKYGHYIEGVDYFDESQEITIFNPSTGRSIGKILSASEQTIDKAVSSSLMAFEKWKETSLSKRVAILFLYKFLL